MLSVIPSLPRALIAVVLIAITTASAGSVSWSSPAPGEPLQPADASAADAIHLLQEGDTVVWTSQRGTVSVVTTLGWPSTAGDDELGGAMVVEAFYRTTGTLTVGEPPKSVSFQFEG